MNITITIFAYGKAFSKNLLKFGINSKLYKIEIPKFNINNVKKRYF